MNFNVLQAELVKYSFTGNRNGTIELTYHITSQWWLSWERLCQSLFVTCSGLFDGFLP